MFGPDKISENIGMFLSYFMVRKVIAGQELIRAAGTVTKKLAKWLAEKGYVSGEEAQSAADIGGQAARDLPKAETAAQLLYEATENLPVGLSESEEEDHLDFDHYTVVKIEPGKVWIDARAGGYAKTLGPIAVPREVTKLLGEGWDISCSLARVRGEWRIVEVGNVYPL